MKSMGYTNKCEYINTYMHVITINAKKLMNLESDWGPMGEVGGRKVKGEI